MNDVEVESLSIVIFLDTCLAATYQYQYASSSDKALILVIINLFATQQQLSHYLQPQWKWS